MPDEKVLFLKNELFPALRGIPATRKPGWGKMDAQQMVEHLIDFFRLANGKKTLPLLTTDPERLSKMRDFLASDKPFRENTRATGVAEDEPAPHQFPSLAHAIDIAESELNDFFNLFREQPDLILQNPFFGDMNFEYQVFLLYKHTRHHLRQFGVGE